VTPHFTLVKKTPRFTLANPTQKTSLQRMIQNQTRTTTTTLTQTRTLPWFYNFISENIHRGSLETPFASWGLATETRPHLDKLAGVSSQCDQLYLN